MFFISVRYGKTDYAEKTDAAHRVVYSSWHFPKAMEIEDFSVFVGLSYGKEHEVNNKDAYGGRVRFKYYL